MRLYEDIFDEDVHETDYFGNDNELSIIITLPSNIEWDDYKKELYVAACGDILNFKVSTFPKEVGPGDKCYLVHRGVIKGWMIITGFAEKEFTCTTTGKHMAGKFIERGGDFHYLNDSLPMRGFQGWRYFSLSEYKKELGIDDSGNGDPFRKCCYCVHYTTDENGICKCGKSGRTVSADQIACTTDYKFKE